MQAKRTIYNCEIKSLEFGLFVNYHVLDKKDW